MALADEGKIQLSDGRQLGYAQWGAPDAPAIVYCHGQPGNRREIEFAVGLVERNALHVRIVAFDRPGYGLSTFQRGRAFLDWPGDVATACDALDITTFAVLGASGGSPYALACGLLLADRVTRIGIVVGVGPPEAPGMDRSALFTLPSKHRLVRRAQFAALAFSFRTGHGDRAVAQSVEQFAPRDQAAMERPEVRAWFHDVFAEAVAQGGKASAYEIPMYWRDWGFDLGQVQHETLLWYGGQDTNVAASIGRWLDAQLPNSRLTVWPQHGHFSWAFSEECLDVVRQLAADADQLH